MNSTRDNWETISKFVSDLRNASRLGAYVDTVVDIYESEAWRRYVDATGSESQWRKCEFDYFLIACGAEYGDVQRLLSWDKARAVDLASAMESDDARLRRPLDKVADSWRSPTGAQLTDLADRQGWTKKPGSLRVSPAPQRARARARNGVTMDEQARKTRASKIETDRRQALGKLVSTVVADTSDELELRYVIDILRDHLAKNSSATRD